MSCLHGECKHNTESCCWFCTHALIRDFQCNDCDEIGEVECSSREGDPRICSKYRDVRTQHFTSVNVISENDIDFYRK